MKRLWLGRLILLFLLVGSLLVQILLFRVHSDISRDLEQAALAAMSQDWASSLSLARTALSRWQRWHHFTAAFADHNPMDELDSLFAQLPVYAQNREDPHFAATCKELSFLAKAMAESHKLSWWNFL